MIKRLILLAIITLTFAAARAAAPAHIVFMIGEDEYHTWDTLPAFADQELKPRGYLITIVNQDPADHNNFPGLVAALHDADLLFLSTRRRTPPQDQLDAVRAHLAAGKPLVGIRTACHAFALRPKQKLAAPGLAAWQGFDPEVLGGHYTDHYRPQPTITIEVAPEAEQNPIVQGIAMSALQSTGELYEVSPLANDTTPLLLGVIPGHPAEPVAWTRRYGPNHARVFFTSLGAPADFQHPAFQHLLVNGVVWALGK